MDGFRLELRTVGRAEGGLCPLPQEGMSWTPIREGTGRVDEERDQRLVLFSFYPVSPVTSKRDPVPEPVFSEPVWWMDSVPTRAKRLTQ
jgi:hypothetical protein